MKSGASQLILLTSREKSPRANLLAATILSGAPRGRQGHWKMARHLGSMLGGGRKSSNLGGAYWRKQRHGPRRQRQAGEGEESGRLHRPAHGVWPRREPRAWPAVTLAVPAAATPERLTKILRRSGVLGDERVTDVRPESERNTLLSTWMRLRLTYDAGANASLPASLFFKTRRGDSTVTFEESGRREVEFYAQVASLMPAGHVPRCFEAAMGADGDWHL